MIDGPSNTWSILVYSSTYIFTAASAPQPVDITVRSEYFVLRKHDTAVTLTVTLTLMIFDNCIFYYLRRRLYTAAAIGRSNRTIGNEVYIYFSSVYFVTNKVTFLCDLTPPGLLFFRPWPQRDVVKIKECYTEYIIQRNWILSVLLYIQHSSIAHMHTAVFTTTTESRMQNHKSRSSYIYIVWQ